MHMESFFDGCDQPSLEYTRDASKYNAQVIHTATASHIHRVVKGEEVTGRRQRK